MKIKFAVLTGFFLSMIQASAFAIEFDHTISLIDNVPQLTFVPPGFDNNDRAQIVVAGYYPDTCYKQGPTTATVDEKNKKIWVKSKAYYYYSCWCLQTIVPFEDTVELGVLKSGKYEIAYVDEKGNKTPTTPISISVATSNQPDDFLYASVSQIFIDQKKELTVDVAIPGGCSEFQELKVLYRVPNIVEVLPIAKVVQNEKCNQQPTVFKAKAQLVPPWSGTSLVYVRSLNGKSMNKVVEF